MARFKIIGVLGGMGPASSWYFEKVLLEQNKLVRVDQDHPPLIHYSNTQIPNRIAALNGKGESPVLEMVRSFEVLKNAGADFGVMICNTAHAFWNEINNGTDFKLLHLIEEAASGFVKTFPGVKKVGLLSTTDTMNRKLYHEFFEKCGVEIVGPDEKSQTLVDKSIFDEKIGIKATGVEASVEAKEILLSVADELVRTNGVEVIIDGCTEISMALGENDYGKFKTIDPLVYLAHRCLELSIQPS